jgi:hypothetical protein
MNLRNKFLIVQFIFFVSCASRTQYKPHGTSGGYSDSSDKTNKILLSRFVGNAYTNEKLALDLSEFRAYEKCFELGYSFAEVIGVDNLSKSQTVQQTSSYNYQNPTYLTGYANTNGTMFGNTYSGATSYNGTISGGGSNAFSTSWLETYNFPAFDTWYTCKNKKYATMVNFKELKAEEVKEYFKDFFGAIHVVEVPEESPNRNILKNGDIVTKINGNRIQSIPQYSAELELATDKNNIPFTVFRDGKLITLKAKAIDSTANSLAEKEKVLTSNCKLFEIKSRPFCSSRLPASK